MYVLGLKAYTKPATEKYYPVHINGIVTIDAWPYFSRQFASTVVIVELLQLLGIFIN